MLHYLHLLIKNFVLYLVPDMKCTVNFAEPLAENSFFFSYGLKQTSLEWSWPTEKPKQQAKRGEP